MATIQTLDDLDPASTFRGKLNSNYTLAVLKRLMSDNFNCKKVVRKWSVLKIVTYYKTKSHPFEVAPFFVI